MSIEKWRDWFELIALIAVVGSLIAVIAELRQTQTAMRAQAYQARAFDGIAWNLELAANDDMRNMLDQLSGVTTGFDASSLNPEEFSLAYRLLVTVRIDVDNEHLQYQSGFLDAGFYHGDTVERIKLYAPIWRELGIVAPRPEFQAEVDRILAEDK